MLVHYYNTKARPVPINQRKDDSLSFQVGRVEDVEKSKYLMGRWCPHITGHASSYKGSIIFR